MKPAVSVYVKIRQFVNPGILKLVSADSITFSRPAGEVREWENTFYAADIFAAGEKRALVTIGRVVSEDPGMRACAEWLKTVVKGVPSKWIGAGDPWGPSVDHLRRSPERSVYRPFFVPTRSATDFAMQSADAI